MSGRRSPQGSFVHSLVPGVVGLLVVALVGCGDDTTAKKSSELYPTPAPTKTVVPVTTPTPTPADNTAKNARDDGSTTTPLDQGLSKEDTAITQAIRQAVVADKGLSVNAQNAKIITKDGMVTLRGPVASQAERLSLADMAQKVAGVKMVHNQLEVATQ